MSGDQNLTLGTTVFKRTEKLRALLDSAEEAPVSRVVVADDGDTAVRQSVYNDEWAFDLEVVDLPLDAGLGRGRQALVEELDTEFMLLVDSDMRVPDRVMTLVKQLRATPELGGISGLLLEEGRLSGMCHDIVEDGDLLVRDTPEEKVVEWVQERPLIRFDFIPNAAVFRRSCLTEYPWDPEYTIGKEHLDFYVGHYHGTEWEFAVCPEILFPHHPGGDAEFVSTRHDPSRLLESKQYFLEKWDYRQVLRKHYWLDHAHPDPVLVRLAGALPRQLQPLALDTNEAVWRAKGRVLDAADRLLGRRQA